MITYTAEIDIIDDNVSQNNENSAFVYVEDMANILIIQERGRYKGDRKNT